MLIGHQDINITADGKHLLSRVPVTNPSAHGPLAKLSLNKLSKEHHTICEATLSIFFFFFTSYLLCSRAMPYVPQLQLSWEVGCATVIINPAQVYKAIWSAPPPRYAE